MNSAMSWSVKGIEPDVREAAKLAARKSGLTLGQWLNSMIRDTADQRSGVDEDFAVPPRDAVRKHSETYEERLDYLATELARLTHRQTEAAIPQHYGLGAVVDPGATPLQHLLERLDRNEHETVRAFETLHDRLSTLSQELSETKEEAAMRPAAVSVAGESHAFEAALRNVVDHIESADKENRDILSDLNARLEDLGREVASKPKGTESANKKILGDVERRLTALAHRVDQIGDTDPAEIQQNVEGKLTTLAEQIEQIAISAADETPSELENRLSELAHRVEMAEQAASQTQSEITESLEHRLGNLGERLEVIRETSAQTAEQVATQAVQSTQDDFREIETQVRALAEQMQATSGLDPETERTISGLMQQMSQVSQDVQQIKVESATENDVQNLRSGLDNLSHIMEQKFANATHEPAFTALEQRLNDVSQRLEQTINSPQPDPQVDNLERRVHEIDARLAASLGDSRTEELVGALGSQIDGLAQRVAHSEQQHTGVQAIEKSIAQLFESVEQTRTFAAEAAEQAAGRVAEQMAGNGGTSEDSSTIQAIEQGLQALRTSAENADQRNQETLEAVHDTLEKVIVRLVALEEAPGGTAPGAPPALPSVAPDTEAPSSGLADLQLPPIPPMPSPQGFVAPDAKADTDEPSWKAAVDAKSAEQMEELFSGTEPALPPLGEPPETPPAAEGVQPAPPAPAGDPTSRRNDFIAAARRAAQVASEPAEEAAGSGPFKALRRGLGKKTAEDGAASGKSRRPLILAAIVLLMIGAASAYKVIGGSDSPADPMQVTAPEPTEDVAPPETETEPVEAVPAPEPDEQSSLTTPPPETTADTPQPAATADPVNQTTGPGKQSLAEPQVDPQVEPNSDPSAVPLPPVPASDTITTGSIQPVDKKTDKTTENSILSPADSALLTMPWMQSTQTLVPPKQTPPATVTTERSVTPKAEPAPERKVTPASAPIPKNLPPVGVGPLGMRIAAANGDAVAQFMVATAYTEGGAVKQDFRTAAQWYQKAAARGLAPAQYRLGTFYEKGKGVPQDVAAARIWYQRAAEKGNRKAMHNLAVIYADGSRSTPDFDKAGTWFRNAAELGLKDSQYNLGILHERGLGVAKDLSQAYKWFALAAKQGDRDAATRLKRIEDRLAPQALIQAKLEIEGWTAKAPDTAANTVTPPAGKWKELASNVNATSLAKRELITEAQSLLNKLGYSAGLPDGVMGNNTREAILHYQKANDLPQTGAVSPSLITSLRKKNG